MKTPSTCTVSPTALRRTVAAAALSAGLLLAAPARPAGPAAPSEGVRRTLDAAALVASRFVEDQDVLGLPRFTLAGRALALSATADGMLWSLGRDPECGEPSAEVAVFPVAGRSDVVPVGRNRLPGRVSRFHGSSESWRSNLASWSGVDSLGVWEGIDLQLDVVSETAKSTRALAPGAEPAQLRLRHKGVHAARIDDRGRLVLETAAGPLLDDAPIAWQLRDGQAVDVPASFALGWLADGTPEVSFSPGDYGSESTLWIDPAVVVLSGFIGGTDGEDRGLGIDEDSGGRAWVVGHTNSDELSFPLSGGPGLTHGGSTDAFVARVRFDGTGLDHCGYNGGALSEAAHEVDVDSTGTLHVGGFTSSDGSSVLWCGYVGGMSTDYVFDLEGDANDGTWLTGRTFSSDASFPEVGGPDLT